MELMVERDSDSGKKKGGRVGETKATRTNILKRKHRLKEGKGFTRVGWILDYGLRLREEKGVGGWEKKTTEDLTCKTKEGRTALTRGCTG